MNSKSPFRFIKVNWFTGLTILAGWLISGAVVIADTTVKVAELTPSQPGILKPKPFPSPKFEEFENDAIEMAPKQVSISYPVGQRKYSTQLIEGQLKKFCPGNSTVDVSYSLRNKTTKNYRFHVCLNFASGICMARQQVTFIGNQTIHVKHHVRLAKGSGRFVVIAPDILINGGANDVTPIYFSGPVEIKSPSCGAGKSCCESLPNGCCKLCVKSGQPCP